MVQSDNPLGETRILQASDHASTINGWRQVGFGGSMQNASMRCKWLYQEDSGQSPICAARRGIAHGSGPCLCAAGAVAAEAIGAVICGALATVGTLPAAGAAAHAGGAAAVAAAVDVGAGVLCRREWWGQGGARVSGG